MNTRFFKEIIIWQPIDDKTIARYRCFEVLPDRKFFVKAKDYLYENSDEKHWNSLERYYLENLFDGILDELALEASDSIDEAIAKHEADFKELIEEIEESKKTQ